MPDRESQGDPSQSKSRSNDRETDREASRETEAERRRRRAQFLRELTEARELRDRVQPRRAKTARLRHAMRMRTFRW
ncbi:MULTISPECIES: hypothetical protein [unclassified Streptomyces]|uniref:hypothetical protein n=1 Tax=unclassified Streptomyces TaxID=2593676 RepID=UPI0036F03B03